MNWAGLSALLAALSCHPAVLILCALIGAAAGAWAGHLARGTGPRYPEDADDAGDTQANWDAYWRAVDESARADLDRRT